MRCSVVRGASQRAPALVWGVDSGKAEMGPFGCPFRALRGGSRRPKAVARTAGSRGNTCGEMGASRLVGERGWGARFVDGGAGVG